LRGIIMKVKSAIVMLILFLVSAAFANGQDQWYQTNQATVSWDPVTEYDSGGESIPTPSYYIKYEVSISNVLNSSDKSDAIVVTESPIYDTQYTITFEKQGRFVVGVRAIGFTTDYVDNEVEIARSEIAWSDNSICCFEEKTFGINHHFAPMPPRNLRKVN